MYNRQIQELALSPITLQIPISNSSPLPYFPELYPGELLYSAIARFILHTSAVNNSSLNQMLFGKPLNTITHDLPTGLDHLAQKIPASRRISSDLLIKNHTLFNYYTAFIDIEKKSHVENMMRSINPAYSFRRQSHIKSHSRLRFCPECQSEMIRNHGEPYWLRDHQIPLVYVCHIHQCSLRYSYADISKNSKIYYTANKTTCPENMPDIINYRNAGLHDHMLRIAEKSFSIMQSPPPFSDHGTMRQTYLDSLWKKGLLKGDSTLDISNIRIRANAYFKTIINEHPGLNLPDNPKQSWLFILLRKKKANAHSIYHILFQDFIEHQADAATAGARKTQEAFEEGPWPCFNPIADHKTDPKVKVIDERRVGTGYRGRFECECGYIYSRTRDSEGKMGRHVVRFFGETLRSFLAEAVKASWSQKMTANKLKISHTTLRNHAALLGIKETPMRK